MKAREIDFELAKSELLYFEKKRKLAKQLVWLGKDRTKVVPKKEARFLGV